MKVHADRYKENEHYDIDTLDELKEHIAKSKENGEVPGFV